MSDDLSQHLEPRCWCGRSTQLDHDRVLRAAQGAMVIVYNVTRNCAGPADAAASLLLAIRILVDHIASHNIDTETFFTPLQELLQDVSVHMSGLPDIVEVPADDGDASEAPWRFAVEAIAGLSPEERASARLTELMSRVGKKGTAES